MGHSQHIFIFTHSLTFTHIHSHFEKSGALLKPPQRSLFIGFLFPCYIVSATTVAVAAAAGGAGRIGSITQRHWHSSSTRPRPLHGVTCVFLGLRAVVGVRWCPRGPAHGVDLCD